MKFPEHKCGLSLTHNEHRNYYETAAEWIAKQEQFEVLLSWPEGERQRAIDTGEVWVLQWYPETPIGFFCVAASTLEACLAAAMRGGSQ